MHYIADLETMTIRQLRRIASELGVRYIRQLEKFEMIQCILEEETKQQWLTPKGGE